MLDPSFTHSCAAPWGSNCYFRWQQKCSKRVFQCICYQAGCPVSFELLHGIEAPFCFCSSCWYCKQQACEVQAYKLMQWWTSKISHCFSVIQSVTDWLVTRQVAANVNHDDSAGRTETLPTRYSMEWFSYCIRIQDEIYWNICYNVDHFLYFHQWYWWAVKATCHVGWQPNGRNWQQC